MRINSKSLFLRIFLIFSFALPFSYSGRTHAQLLPQIVDPAGETEIVEQTLEEVGTQKTKGNIQISLGRETAYEVVELPATAEELAPFSSLTEAKQVVFKEKRLSFLKQIARVLNSTKLVLGSGSLVGSSFVFMKDAIKTRNQPDTPRSFGISTDFELLRERSHRVVQAVLNSVDKKLWAQAPLLTSSNEYGVSVSVAIIAVAGVLTKGGGGVQDLGLSFAFNKDKKALVFEIFHNSEKFTSGEPFTFVLGVAPKVGLTAARRTEGIEGMTLRGVSHGVPVLPATVGMGADNFAFTGVFTVGLPPSPLADILPGFATAYKKQTLFRVSVSPIVRGFIRVEVGDMKGQLRAIRSSVEAVWNGLSKKMAARRSGVVSLSCGSVF